MAHLIKANYDNRLWDLVCHPHSLALGNMMTAAGKQVHGQPLCSAFAHYVGESPRDKRPKPGRGGYHRIAGQYQLPSYPKRLNLMPRRM